MECKFWSFGPDLQWYEACNIADKNLTAFCCCFNLQGVRHLLSAGLVQELHALVMMCMELAQNSSKENTHPWEQFLTWLKSVLGQKCCKNWYMYVYIYIYVFNSSLCFLSPWKIFPLLIISLCQLLNCLLPFGVFLKCFGTKTNNVFRNVLEFNIHYFYY